MRTRGQGSGRKRWRWAIRFALLSVTVVAVGCFRMVSGLPSPKATSEQVARLDAGWVDVPGVPGRRLRYTRAGDASAQRLIFIHGSPGSSEDYADYLVNPPPGFEVLAVDRLGYGASITRTSMGGREDHAEVLSFQEQADAIEPLLVERGGKWPILVGHSLGGPIAARLAADNPERVGGLLILAGSLDPAYEHPRWYNEVLDWTVVTWIAPRPITHSNREMFAAGEQETLLAGVLNKVVCPVTIIHGTEDPLVPFGNMAYTKRMMTSAARIETIEVPKEGHFLPWKQEGLVREAVEKLAGHAEGLPGSSSLHPRP